MQIRTLGEPVTSRPKRGIEKSLISLICFSDDYKLLGTAEERVSISDVSVWDLSQTNIPKEKWSFQVEKTFCMNFCCRDSVLLSGGDHGIRSFNLHTKEVSLFPMIAAVRSISTSKNGLILLGFENGLIQVYNQVDFLSIPSPLYQISLLGSIMYMHLSKNENLIAVCTTSKSFSLLEILEETGELRQLPSLFPHQQYVWACFLSKNYHHAFTCSGFEENTLTSWDLEKKVELGKLKLKQSFDLIDFIENLDRCIYATDRELLWTDRHLKSVSRIIELDVPLNYMAVGKAFCACGDEDGRIFLVDLFYEHRVSLLTFIKGDFLPILGVLKEIKNMLI